MAYSTEFRRAVAAAAVTRLIAGRRNLDAAARVVSKRLGNVVFPDRKENDRIRMLLEYRKKILAVDPKATGTQKVLIARYHYDQCMKWVADNNLKPEESSDLLVQTLLGATQN